MSKKLGTCDNLETLHTENWQCVGTWQPVTATAEPAEYTCPRCDSNVSTHICMGEPVAGETDEPDLCSSTHEGYVCTNYQGHAGDHLTQGMPGKILHRWPNPAPSVAVPEGEATNVKGESIDLRTNEYLVQRMLENYARTLATGSESQHNEAFRCRAEVIRRMAAHVLAEKGKG